MAAARATDVSMGLRLVDGSGKGKGRAAVQRQTRRAKETGTQVEATLLFQNEGAHAVAYTQRLWNSPGESVVLHVSSGDGSQLSRFDLPSHLAGP